MSVLMSRPAWAQWAARYARLRARAVETRIPMTGPIVAHVARLEVMARTHPELRGIAAAVAADNGVKPVQDSEKDG